MPLSKPITVLSYGDNALASTGYGCIWENLLTRWAQTNPDSKVYNVGWQNLNREEQTRAGYYNLPTGRDDMGIDTMLPYINKYNPDFIITMADVGKQLAFIERIKDAKRRGWRGKWLAYTPVDTPDWSIYWDEMFGAPDIIIAMSKFGEFQMKKYGVTNEAVSTYPSWR